MDLSALGSTLPPGLGADVERDMGDKFRAAALSITTLYKASLNSTKQSYQGGYLSCIHDILSMVQESIANGQDASDTLSRLMDWAEAREAAMAAFAAEETDEPSPAAASSSAAAPALAPAPAPRRAAAARHALQHLNAPPRSASAPVPDHMHTPSGATTPTIPAPQTWQNTPVTFASSSPSTSASSSAARPALVHSVSNRKVHHSPVRPSHRVEAATIGHAPQSTFNPSLPQLPPAGVPFVTTPSIPIGSKRQIVDVEMADETGHTSRATPSRASKRRSLGSQLGGRGEESNDADKDRDRRRGGRRGHGPGPAGPGITG